MDVSSLLRSARNDDGGFGPRAGAPSEPEATAMAAMALGDANAVAWLASQQRDDGGFGAVVGSIRADCTAVVALALALGQGSGQVRVRALDHLVAFHAERAFPTGVNTYDLTVSGWSWTAGAFGWTEPTSWGLLALRVGRPAATERILDAVRLLRDRRCVGGGWNFGTSTAYGVELPPFVETTAIACIALDGQDTELAGEGFSVLGTHWRAESSGLLSIAAATAAFRLAARPEWPEAERVLRASINDLVSVDTVALAWAGIALGDGLELLRP